MLARSMLLAESAGSSNIYCGAMVETWCHRLRPTPRPMATHHLPSASMWPQVCAVAFTLQPFLWDPLLPTAFITRWEMPNMALKEMPYRSTEVSKVHGVAMGSSISDPKAHGHIHPQDPGEGSGPGWLEHSACTWDALGKSMTALCQAGPLLITVGLLSPLSCLFFLLLLSFTPLFNFSFFFCLNEDMVAIALPLLSISLFISNFDAFSLKDTRCFSQEQSAIKTRSIK